MLLKVKKCTENCFMFNVSSNVVITYFLNDKSFTANEVESSKRDCGGWRRMDVGFSLTSSCTDAKCFLSR